MFSVIVNDGDNDVVMKKKKMKLLQSLNGTLTLIQILLKHEKDDEMVTFWNKHSQILMFLISFHM